MASDVEIANMALSGMGANTIQSFLDDSNEARAVNAVYTFCRDDVMAAYPWNFAVERVTFAKLDEDPSSVTGEFSNVYQLPTDTLRVLWIEPRTYRFKVEKGGKLYTNAGAPLKGAIIRRITDSASFSTPFIMALVYRLRAEISLALTGNRAIAQQYYALYSQKLQEACTTDSLEGSPEIEDTSPIGDVRLSGSASVVGIYYDGFYAR